MAYIIEIKYNDGSRAYVHVEGVSYSPIRKTWATKFGSQAAAEAFVATMPVYSFCNAIVRVA